MVAMSERPTKRARGKKSKGAKSELVGRVTESAAEVAGRVREGAAAATQEIVETVSEVSRSVVDAVGGEAEKLFEARRGKAVEKVAGVGKAARQAAHALRAANADRAADYLVDAAGRVEQAAEYLKDRTLADLADDAADLARREPVLAAGAMFVVGLAAARFLKASEARRRGAP